MKQFLEKNFVAVSLNLELLRIQKESASHKEAFSMYPANRQNLVTWKMYVDTEKKLYNVILVYKAGMGLCKFPH